MKVAYIRVSTEEQNADRQIEAMNKLGIAKQFTEKISAKDMDRPQLKAMLDFVREGDVVVVESFSRLSRSTKDLLTIIEKLQLKKQIQSNKADNQNICVTLRKIPYLNMIITDLSQLWESVSQKHNDIFIEVKM